MQLTVHIIKYIIRLQQAHNQKYPRQILKTYLLFYFYILNKEYYFFQRLIHLYQSQKLLLN